MKINNKIKDFFKDFDIDIDDIFDEEEMLEEIDESTYEPSLKNLLDKIGEIQNSNNAHKVLFAAGLFELRMQVKKIQEQEAETRKQLERGIKDIQLALTDIDKKEESLSKKFDLLKDSINTFSRTMTSSRKTS